jgi:lysophospholipase L1-like esterase
VIVAVVGDSISAGSPLWDPDPAVRATIDAPDERSQWQWWAAHSEPRLEFRTRAAYGKRTDEIAAFLDDVVDGADVLVVQGGINDVAQGRSTEDAARNLAAMVERGRSVGLPVALADVLPWPGGDTQAARDIARLNDLIHGVDGVIALPFHDTVAPLDRSWSNDGAHPSVDAHRLLGEAAARALARDRRTPARGSNRAEARPDGG